MPPMYLRSPSGTVIDPSGFEKDGKKSVGVQRQWLGRFGKVDNGQVGVYLGYASRRGHALCDLRLYLPAEWAADRVRRRECGVPKEVRFQTKHELAQAMLVERGAVLPHRWVAGDDEMGRSTRFRRWLREHAERYLLAVPSNTSVRDLEAAAPAWSGHGAKPKARWTTVRRWLEQLPDAAWTQIEVRDGEQWRRLPANVLVGSPGTPRGCLSNRSARNFSPCSRVSIKPCSSNFSASVMVLSAEIISG